MSSADQQSNTPAAMASATELPGSAYTTRLEEHNAELKKALADVRASLEAYQKESSELRETFVGLKQDAQFVKNQAAKIQGEVKMFSKPRRTTQRKRDLDQAQARVGELEKQLENVKKENADLRQMVGQANNASANWQGQYEALQAQNQERCARIAQLEAENAALGMLAGQELPLDTPPMEYQYPMDLGADFAVDAPASQPSQATQPDQFTGQMADFDQFGGYGY
ncbi:hypothetical protein F4806DRAFT_501231 [Annulohypoxylon nitens]|nr:hypothetical protein F4806DRAFT_501231 [Annulohypoxylon nitens]